MPVDGSGDGGSVNKAQAVGRAGEWVSRDSIDSEGLLGGPIGGDVEMPRDGRGGEALEER